MGTMKTMLRKFWFANSRWSKMVCPCCGDRFEIDDAITKISIGNMEEYFHEDCLDEMNGKEALEMFKAEIEEVEL